ncbi:MAG: hypothetical protein IPJ13_26320 [Saprospiraceae bacterium]|nr:hypothetical protein [Saprospiraceae bacterium]
MSVLDVNQSATLEWEIENSDTINLYSSEGMKINVTNINSITLLPTTSQFYF